MAVQSLQKLYNQDLQFIEPFDSAHKHSELPSMEPPNKGMPTKGKLVDIANESEATDNNETIQKVLE